MARKLRADAEKLYQNSWTRIWSLPRKVVVCENTASCTITSLSNEVAAVRTAVRSTPWLAQNISRALKRGGEPRDGAKLSKKVRAIHEANIKAIDELPRSTLSCP